MKHFINVVLLILALTLVLLYITDPPAWMPLAASAEAGPVDWLFGLHFDVIIFLYVLVNGILLYAVVACPGANRAKPAMALFPQQHQAGDPVDGHPPGHCALFQLPGSGRVAADNRRRRGRAGGDRHSPAVELVF